MNREPVSRAAPSVLFVCLGNICRSPLAEAALRQVAEARGIAIRVNSAGTGDWHVGSAPDPRARAEAKARGIDISGYRARQVRAADFDDYDHVVALDAKNLADLREIRPAGGGARLSLLLDHVPGREGQGVIDPYFGDADGFAATWEEVQAAAEAIADLLTAATERA
ncbi:low molecular weight protein-tyrosine-phosphatase [Sphingomonas sp. 37zxx]|uniref:low molecular weight protein-tyrosine-phosphatase n=1 Tax=Sphingomonas sp. 37zxx TaxID=1550073 RepID=UPI00053BDE67|nr:low molecular weight protein-tyrosine-phosphatase [Sphingomonas sp. 37zxx]